LAGPRVAPPGILLVASNKQAESIARNRLHLFESCIFHRQRPLFSAGVRYADVGLRAARTTDIWKRRAATHFSHRPPDKGVFVVAPVSAAPGVIASYDSYELLNAAQ